MAPWNTPSKNSELNTRCAELAHNVVSFCVVYRSLEFRPENSTSNSWHKLGQQNNPRLNSKSRSSRERGHKSSRISRRCQTLTRKYKNKAVGVISFCILLYFVYRRVLIKCRNLSFGGKGPITIRRAPLPTFLVNFSTFAFLLNFSFMK